MRGGPGPTAAEPPPAAASVAEDNSGGEEEEEQEEDDELELGLCLGSNKKQTPQPPCRILTARDLQPGALSPDSSVSSSLPAAAGTAACKRAKADATTSPGTLPSGHPPHSGFGAVGWPPVGAFRMNTLFNQAKDNASVSGTNKAVDEPEVQKDKEETEKNGSQPCLKGRVKVNMDGDAIGRKVDLNAHHSYQTLASALELMFMKPSIGLCTSTSADSLKLLDSSSEYQLTYEDRDGDWMLVGDVPWELFVGSVKRLRIMRNTDGNGLGPRFQGVHRTAASARGRS